MYLNNIFSALYRSYVLKNLFRDVTRFVRENFSEVEWDKDYWLHKIGLSTYKPVKSSMGGLSIFLLGVAAGGIAALAFAPKPGIEWRSEVKDKAKNLVGRAQIGAEKVQGEVPARV